MSWKITQTKHPNWLAVLGPYDDDFIADIKALPKAERHFDDDARAWKVRTTQRRALELIIAKHSPPERVELKRGAEGVEQLFSIVDGLGAANSYDDDVIREGLDLALDGDEHFVEYGKLRTSTVRVDGLLVHILAVPLLEDA